MPESARRRNCLSLHGLQLISKHGPHPSIALSSEMLGKAEVNTQGWSARQRKYQINTFSIWCPMSSQQPSPPGTPIRSQDTSQAPETAQVSRTRLDVSSELSPLGISDRACDAPTSGSG